MATFVIADDSRMLRRTLKMLLEAAGHTIVAEADNGIDAFVEYRKHKPDLITLDYSMPIMDGLETARKLLGEYPAARIVIISSDNNQEKIYAALKAGVKYYIVKPITKDKVAETLDKILNEPSKNFFND